ncbi:hypothetical protein Z042_09300 [Chania multitudinisentens RB-25]|uniref:Outer membrane protein assembly factor BamE domain-containing protein n=1 Tax=Chania multitudinisentens RB-25 TaxID=1441930 RepID=W0L7S0_9GAMM|nr:outer membrane protein assembly factor BamE [Chania multitudinisentens]AHG19796.2 hypothetical protein Z042_09300 [Chania multitudinisentens RB-25]
MRKSIKFILFFIVLLTTGCVGNIDRTKEGTISKYSEKQLVESLVVGKSTKRDVLLYLGRPSIPEDYNGSNSWYYFSEKTDRRLYGVVFLNLDEKISLSLDFDDNKILKKISYKKQ